jgi:hypothetical protein
MWKTSRVGTPNFKRWLVCITKYLYIKSTTVYVPSSELGLPTPLPQASVPFPPDKRVGGGGTGHTCLRLKGWGSPNSNDWRKMQEVGVLIKQKYSRLSEVSQLRYRPARLHRLGLNRV